METTTSTTTSTTTNNQPEPPKDTVTYLEYTNANLSFTPPESKTVPPPPPVPGQPAPSPQTYYQIPLMFNYGTAERPMYNDFMFQGCEIETSVGIQSKPGLSGRMEHSIPTRFNLSNTDQNTFLGAIGQIHQGCCFIIQQNKGAVKLYDFTAQAPGGLFKNPIYRPRDEVTGDYIQGRAPSLFLKLFSRGKEPYVEQTLFTDPKGVPIPWTLLRNVEMKFIPLIHVKRIYVGGGKASLQMEVVSAVVTSIRARNTATRQTDLIQSLRQQRPELADQVAAQLAKLTTDRQDQMLSYSEAPSPNAGGQGEPQPTFSGIAPSGRQPATTTTTTTSAASSPTLPNIPNLGTGQPAMHDLLANAPTRTPAIPAATLHFN